MRTNQIKIFAIIVFAVPLLLLAAFNVKPVSGATFVLVDSAATYKAKCAACHTPTASKFYDPAKPDETHVQIILNGKKGEKPPFMPGFAEKGMNENEAKELAAYMRTLRSPN